LRETLFNVLARRIAGARVLDGYAGTGAVGIEALSRGASHVTFVDEDPRAQALVAANLAHCGVKNGYIIIRAGFPRALSALPADAEFDIILLDPPYEQLKSVGQRGDHDDAAENDVKATVAAAGDRLAPDGVLVLEHSRRHGAADKAGRLVRARELEKGDSALTFYEVKRAL
jgi:16S rRNA (guanine(966)-N(2))-methyltransferase RsmD